MSEERDKELGALWLKVSKNGNIYYTGSCLGKNIVMFAVPESYREKNPKLPAFRIFESKDRNKE